MFKLLPTVFHRYDLKLVSPEWKVHTSWFHRVTDINVTAKRR